MVGLNGGELRMMTKYAVQPKDHAANLIKYQKNVYSQNGEGGVLEKIFRRLKISEKGARQCLGA